MEEQVYLKYGAKIALKSILNNNYVKVNHNEGNAVARGHHLDRPGPVPQATHQRTAQPPRVSTGGAKGTGAATGHYLRQIRFDRWANLLLYSIAHAASARPIRQTRPSHVCRTPPSCSSAKGAPLPAFALREGDRRPVQAGMCWRHCRQET